jgi:molecular chaperone DnaK (HSP70)
MASQRRMAPRSSFAAPSVTLPLRDSAERLSTAGGPSTSHPGSNRKGKSKAVRGRLLVGIDYGTAHTSVAYSYIPPGQDVSPGSLGARLDRVNLITKWPGGPGTAFVPTVTMYDSAQRRSRAPNLPKWWGYKVQRALDREEAPDTARAVHLAKLILHEARETEKEADRLRHLAEEVGRKEIDLIMDFLQQLYNYLLGDNGYFIEHHASWLADSDIDFVFGVPAAWSEPEQQAMVEAAKSLGFITASRGSEPEAMAASYFAQHETSIEVGYPSEPPIYGAYIWRRLVIHS